MAHLPLIFKRRHFAGLLLAGTILASTSSAASACDCAGPIAAAAQATISGINTGISSLGAAITSALTADTQLIVQAISGNQQIQTTAYDKLLSAAQNQNAQAVEARQNITSNRRFVENPSSCYTLTAASAMPAAQTAIKTTTSAIVKDQTDWSMGQNNSATKYGKLDADHILVVDHFARIGATSSGSSTVPSSADPSLHPEFVMDAKTLTNNEINGTGTVNAVTAAFPADHDHPNGPVGWVRDLFRLSINPKVHPLDIKNATPEVVAGELAKQTHMNFARLPLSTAVAMRREGTSLHDWAVALVSQIGGDTSIIPANPSWHEIMDILINARFSGTSWHAQLGTMSPEQMVRENVEMQSVMLQLEWQRFQYEQKVGAMMGDQYGRAVDSGSGS